MRWLDSITDSMDMNLSKLRETVEGRGVWRTAVHGVAEDQTLLATEQQQHITQLLLGIRSHWLFLNFLLFTPEPPPSDHQPSFLKADFWIVCLPTGPTGRLQTTTHPYPSVCVREGRTVIFGFQSFFYPQLAVRWGWSINQGGLCGLLGERVQVPSPTPSSTNFVYVGAVQKKDLSSPSVFKGLQKPETI